MATSANHALFCVAYALCKVLRCNLCKLGTVEKTSFSVVNTLDIFLSTGSSILYSRSFASGGRAGGKENGAGQVESVGICTSQSDPCHAPSWYARIHS